MQFPTRIAAALLACAFGAIDAAGQTFSIDAHVVSAGSSVLLSGPCFRLQATLAEPVAGAAAGGIYSLTAGFVAATPDAAQDDIFFSTFEACP